MKKMFFFLLFLLCFVSLALNCSKTEPTTGCQQDADCAQETKKKVCDKNNNQCVQCYNDPQCGTSEVCNITTGLCEFKCKTDDDCKTVLKDRTGIVCKDGACQIKCDTHVDCNADEICQKSQCIKGTRPTSTKPNRYQECPKDECEGSLTCLTYKKGETNYCFKKCSGETDCLSGELCVTEDQFADGHNVCMKTVPIISGIYFDYKQGTTCPNELTRVTSTGTVHQGSCWKSCDANKPCDTPFACKAHPSVNNDKFTVCLKPCTADSECEKGATCLKYSQQDATKYCY